MASSLYNQLQNLTTAQAGNLPAPHTGNLPFSQEALSSVRGLMNIARGNTNPMNMIMSTLGGNPQFAGLLNSLKTGISPKDLFYQTANSMGVDPQAVISALTK